jgi:hypothetical protein
MLKQFFLLTGLALALASISCVRESKSEITIAGIDRIEKKLKENIRFDFSAGRINTFKETIEIKATLFNDNADTVYFLSSSCDGEQYSLRYDSSKFILTPFLNCYVSYPTVFKISPKAKHEFQAHFRCNSKVTKIKLGFDFYSVDKTFELRNKNLGDIFIRPKDKQTIIWSDEKTIP